MMNRFHPFTFLALLLATGSVVLQWTGAHHWPIWCVTIAYGLVLIEFKRYTSNFQFSMLVITAVLQGLFLGSSSAGLILTITVTIVSLATVLRQAFMQQFTYVNLLWVEPLLLLLAITGYLHANLTGHTTWEQWIAPLLPFSFAGSLVFGYVQDGLLMKRQVRYGYRVQVNELAPDFTLPDEHGELVTLSDLREKQPVLLLFVRGDWCPGCHMMLRSYEKRREAFARKGVLLLAIGPDDIGVNRDMLQRLGVKFRMLSDHGQGVSGKYGVVYSNPVLELGVDYARGIPLPASFLIDRQGRVQYVSRPERVGEFLNPERVFDVLDTMPELPDTAWMPS